jgi:ferredoxin-thioredoxin reductase catalytic subunit
MEEKIKNLIHEYEIFADNKGIKLNPNKQIVENLVKALLAREEQFGERYCPCRRMSGDKEQDKDIICPCVSCMDEIEKQGHCHCMLFYKK